MGSIILNIILLFYLNTLLIWLGPVVLLMDSGGGRDGMHLSLEFALLMHRHDIHVFALRQYYTRAMMPLDRAPHKEMQLSWSNLRSRFAAEHGFTVTTQFQALAIIREAWTFGSQAKFVTSGFKNCGICPWNPDELLVNQAAELFRSEVAVAASHQFMDPASKSTLRLPDTLMEKKGKCSNCKSALLLRHKHCPECGSANESYSKDLAVAMVEGRRKGYVKVRPSGFDIEELVKTSFAGLKPVSFAGKAAMEDAASSSSSGSSSEEDSEAEKLKTIKAKAVEPPLPPPPPPKPKYDPPTVVPSQLKSKTGIRRAWTDVLSDVEDPKHKKAFLHWLPDFLDSSKKELATHFEKKTATEVIYKSLIDTVVKKSPEDRNKWYLKRVGIMLDAVGKEAAKKVK